MSPHLYQQIRLTRKGRLNTSCTFPTTTKTRPCHVLWEYHSIFGTSQLSKRLRSFCSALHICRACSERGGNGLSHLPPPHLTITPIGIRPSAVCTNLGCTVELALSHPLWLTPLPLLPGLSRLEEAQPSLGNTEFSVFTPCLPHTSSHLISDWGWDFKHIRVHVLA